MSYVGDIHNSLYVVSDVAEVLLKHVLHDVCAEVTDVRKMIYGRTAGVHAHLALLVRGEIFFCSCK